MKTIAVPTREQVSPEAQLIFDSIQKGMGKVPNLYATIGYSATALKAFLDFSEAFNKSAFTPKEREAIYLVVSEVNNCNYCLSAHTLMATMKGFTKDDTIAFRKGVSTDKRINTIIQLAKSLAENKGKADEAVLQNFFDEGFDETALMDLIGLVTLRTFTNYVYANTQIPVDFPAYEPLV